MRRGTSAARAAALLLIASGASGAVSAWFPAIDERWIFVAAIAAIALLEGFLAGLIAIWAAVAAHLLLKGGDFSLIVAAGSVGVLIGGFVHSRRRVVVVPPTPTDVEDELAIARLSMSENDRKLGERIADLEAEVASRDAALTRQLSRIAALDSRLAEANSRAADVESQLTTRVGVLEGRLAAATTRAAELEQQLARQSQSDAVRIVELEEELAEAAERDERDTARIAEHQQQRAEAAERRERDTARIAELEQELAEAIERNEQLEQQLAESAERRQRDAARIAELEPQLAEAIERSDRAAARVNGLEERAEHTDAALETARAASASLAARIEELEQAIDAADSLLVTQRQEAAAQVETVEREWTEKLRRLLEEKDKKHSVLLVHRDPAVHSALERGGYHVIAAADGLEALRVAANAQPDVIVAEAQMQKLDGRAFVQLLKSRPETAKLKIVLMGAAANHDQNSDFRADAVLPDAANADGLKAMLEEVLG